MAVPSLLQAPDATKNKPVDFNAINFVPKGQPITAAVKEEVPGIGTLTRTPKAPISGSSPATRDPLENSAGLYARTGVEPPPAALPEGQFKTPSGAVVDTAGNMISGPSNVPQYGARGTTGPSPSQSILDAYNSLTKSIDEIEKRIMSSSTPSAEEQQLARDLAAKKAQLAQFDVETLQRVEDMYGQGRGRTLGNIAIGEAKERRTRALERLGVATEAQILLDQLDLVKGEREALGDAAKEQYNLAAKRLDISLGVQRELRNLDEDEKDDARQYLLDVVSFAEGKSFEELDPATQSGIMQATANSPITLDMVRTALRRGKESGDKSGELLSVDEARTLGVPYGTTRAEAFGITPQYRDTEGGSGAYGAKSGNPGGYTTQENRRLRQAGIEPTDLEAADRYLYGDGAKRGVMTVSQLEAIGDAFYEYVGKEPSKATDPNWKTPEDLKSFIDGGLIDVNGQKVILSDIQKDALKAQVDLKAQQNKGFFSKFFKFGN